MITRAMYTNCNLHVLVGLDGICGWCLVSILSTPRLVRDRRFSCFRQHPPKMTALNGVCCDERWKGSVVSLADPAGPATPTGDRP